MSDFESMWRILSKTSTQSFEVIPFYDIMIEDGDVITGRAIRVDANGEETFILFDESGMIL